MTNWQRTLTEEVLGECWHEIIPYCLQRDQKPARDMIFPCTKCGKEFGLAVFYTEGKGNRTFTTWQDLGDVKEALVKMGKWEEFYWFTGPALEGTSNKTAWLLCLVNPAEIGERMAMVAEWWEGKKE